MSVLELSSTVPNELLVDDDNCILSFIQINEQIKKKGVLSSGI
jgi:hypothetical protein